MSSHFRCPDEQTTVRIDLSAESFMTLGIRQTRHGRLLYRWSIPYAVPSVQGDWLAICAELTDRLPPRGKLAAAVEVANAYLTEARAAAADAPLTPA